MEKTYAIFLGCNIPVRMKQYETSARAVLEKLGIKLTDIPEFNCCGYPLRNLDRDAFVLSSARNLSLCEKMGLDMMSLCQCGYGTFRMAAHILKHDAGLNKKVNRILLKEGLEYTGNVQIRHFLGVLFHDVGPDVIENKITRKFRHLGIAVHYGCHVLRPSNVVAFDNPVAPRIFDRLVEITGAESIFYPSKLDCCGAPLSGTHNRLSMDFAEKKLIDAEKAGAKYVISACPFCQIQFNTVPGRIEFERGLAYQTIPALLYPQLLGLVMGLKQDVLGIDLNKKDMTILRRSLYGESQAAGSDETPKHEYEHLL